ncbi:hypothetical protein PUN28_019960 [Cardiocondyla obscurior]|uniref:Uncharacterized protein n=1 Tax=Cardiocondyla obscurior TaxID=286306 RepID=A0AAW2ECB2_9HYME
MHEIHKFMRESSWTKVNIDTRRKRFAKAIAVGGRRTCERLSPTFGAADALRRVDARLEDARSNSLFVSLRDSNRVPRSRNKFPRRLSVAFA